MKSSSARQAQEAPFQLLLRIKHPTIDPAEITRELQMAPEHIAAAGSSVSAAGKKCLHSESYWLVELPTPSIDDILGRGGEPLSLVARKLSTLSKETQLRLSQAFGLSEFHLLAQLRKFEAHSVFFKQINETNGSVTLILQRPNRNGPFTVTPGLARRLADLNIGLEID
jgi:hypothetical protein